MLFYQIANCVAASLDLQYGTIIHLPYSGGLLDQPQKTIECWKIVRDVYLEKLKNEQKKASNKSPVSKRR